MATTLELIRAFRKEHGRLPTLGEAFDLKKQFGDEEVEPLKMKKEATIPLCENCHQPIEDKRRTRFCSMECAEEGDMPKISANLPTYYCAYCNESFSPNLVNQKHCSLECRFPNGMKKDRWQEELNFDLDEERR